jgi:hypothetical protein
VYELPVVEGRLREGIGSNGGDDESGYSDRSQERQYDFAHVSSLLI